MKKELCRIKTWLESNPAFYGLQGIFIMPIYQDKDFIVRDRAYWDKVINIPAE